MTKGSVVPASTLSFEKFHFCGVCIRGDINNSRWEYWLYCFINLRSQEAQSALVMMLKAHVKPMLN